jgi:hypothetical protein
VGGCLAATSQISPKEMAGSTSRDLTSKPTTPRTDKESWEFDGNEQDSGEEKNPPKPHANP